jgi:hypothetical protein
MFIKDAQNEPRKNSMSRLAHAIANKLKRKDKKMHQDFSEEITFLQKGVVEKSKSFHTRNISARLSRTFGRVRELEEDEYTPRYSDAIDPCDFSNVDRPLLLLVLSNPELHRMMTKYCNQQYCGENIRLWDCLQRVRKAEDIRAKAQLFQQVWKTFLAQDAKVDVNITQDLKNRITSVCSCGVFDENLFDELEQESMKLLGDVFITFSKSPEYLLFMEAKTSPKPVERKRFSLKLPPLATTEVNVSPRANTAPLSHREIERTVSHSLLWLKNLRKEAGK